MAVEPAPVDDVAIGRAVVVVPVVGWAAVVPPVAVPLFGDPPPGELGCDVVFPMAVECRQCHQVSGIRTEATRNAR